MIHVTVQQKPIILEEIPKGVHPKDFNIPYQIGFPVQDKSIEITIYDTLPIDASPSLEAILRYRRRIGLRQTLFTG